MEERILDLRTAHNPGARCIRSGLLWNDGFGLGLTTIYNGYSSELV